MIRWDVGQWDSASIRPFDHRSLGTGRPWLIDFQISFRLGRRGGDWPRAVLRLLQRQDWYHFFKHKRRTRPDLMTPAQIAGSYRRSGLLSAHRQASRPYFKLRRWVLDRLHLPRGDAAEG